MESSASRPQEENELDSHSLPCLTRDKRIRARSRYARELKVRCQHRVLTLHAITSRDASQQIGMNKKVRRGAGVQLLGRSPFVKLRTVSRTLKRVVLTLPSCVHLALHAPGSAHEMQSTRSVASKGSRGRKNSPAHVVEAAASIQLGDHLFNFYHLMSVCHSDAGSNALCSATTVLNS